MHLHPTGQFDNNAAEYRHIEARPLAAAMGAEIVGVQIATMSGEQFTEVRDSPIGRLAATRDTPALSEDLARKIRGSTHPVTGEKSLYIDPSYGIGIEGLSREMYRTTVGGEKPA